MSELRKAIENQDAFKVEMLLLTRGEDVNEVYSSGDTPLHIAATLPDSESTREILKILVDAGACLSATNEKYNTPLHVSMSHNHETFCGFFVQAEVAQKNGTYKDKQIYARGNVTALQKGIPVDIDLDDYLEHHDIYIKGMKTMYHATGVEHPYEIYQYAPLVYPTNKGAGGWTIKWFNVFVADDDLRKIKIILSCGETNE